MKTKPTVNKTKLRSSSVKMCSGVDKKIDQLFGNYYETIITELTAEYEKFKKHCDMDVKDFFKMIEITTCENTKDRTSMMHDDMLIRNFEINESIQERLNISLVSQIENRGMNVNNLSNLSINPQLNRQYTEQVTNHNYLNMNRITNEPQNRMQIIRSNNQLNQSERRNQNQFSSIMQSNFIQNNIYNHPQNNDRLIQNNPIRIPNTFNQHNQSTNQNHSLQNNSRQHQTQMRTHNQSQYQCQ